MLGSADGRVRVTSWTDEAGRHIEATTSYALLHGRLATVTTVVADGDPELAAQAAGIAATAEVAAPTSMEDESLPLRPGEVDLSEAAALWRAGTTPAPAIDHVLTTEETFAAARHYGVAMLPGADTAQWDQLDGGQRHLASAVAWRSLEVRGAAEGGDLGEALELAASHDLIVMVAERNADDTRATWFAARPDRMVRLRPDGAGRMVLTTHPTGDLADLLLLGHGDPEVTVNASAVFRSEGRVVGDEAGWRGRGPRVRAGRAVRSRDSGRSAEHVMSAIYLDPDQMDATGGVVSELAREVEGMATEVDALATTSVPRPSRAGSPRRCARSRSRHGSGPCSTSSRPSTPCSARNRSGPTSPSPRRSRRPSARRRPSPAPSSAAASSSAR